MIYDKLNFGCGGRFAANWTNIDFHSDDGRVQRVNLLSGFPFADGTFQSVYSSHVLEHFDRTQGRFLLQEAFRVLRKGGVLRIVVPDLQGSCLEYMRILQLPDGSEKRKLYNWIILELLDQMVRNIPSGEMGPFMNEVMNGADTEFKAYIRFRTENTSLEPHQKPNLASKIKKITPQKLATKLSYWYLRIVSYLIPKTLRSMVMVQTCVGERHRWMYDEYGLKILFEEIGFSEIRRVQFNDSNISNFNTYHLDCNPDGQPYKNNSLYMEGTKKGVTH